MSEITTLTQTLREAISACIYGKEDVIEKVLAALYCGGHVLLNDIPGTGKTTLARTLAGALDADFHRIQFTPDLLPTDLIGVSIPERKPVHLRFGKGQCSPRFCWRTRSTVPRPAPSRHCWSAWKNGRSLRTA